MRVITLVMIVAFIPAITFAQFKSNTSSKIKTTPATNVKLNNTTSIVKLSSSDWSKLRNTALTKDLKRIPYIPSPEEIERNRVKNWSVTPAKPYQSGLELAVTGKSDKNGFLVEPMATLVKEERYRQLVGDYSIAWIPVTIKARLLANKDYRLTFTLQNIDVPADGKIILALSEDNIYEIDIQPGEFAYKFLFSASKNETREIGISLAYTEPVSKYTPDYWSYILKSVNLEELVPAQ